MPIHHKRHAFPPWRTIPSADLFPSGLVTRPTTEKRRRMVLGIRESSTQPDRKSGNGSSCWTIQQSGQRSSKKSPKDPDFVHVFTWEGLWIDSCGCPSWVPIKLEALGTKDSSNVLPSDQETLELYSRMREKGSAPGISLIPAALKACSTLKQLEIGTEIHFRLDSDEASHDFVALVHMYSVCGSLQSARSLEGISQEFCDVTHIKLVNVVGCTHFKITQSNSPNIIDYFDRKQRYSIILQEISDVFLIIYYSWPVIMTFEYGLFYNLLGVARARN
ncbi:hypothetical protein SELMODRAFT_413375 [Selaginella moellendorffii]|uniref:Uncharacterized protein n=1 Tax=Selaginella moellendorffii TaxID=88036 RepID=D8RP91_SELML|nr:hypothetical protein SELMODRAFT_413375 [Selaginella moellendorffii]